MKNNLKKTAFLVVVTLIFGGCLSLKQPAKKVDFYTLEYDPPPAAGFELFPFALRLERFSTAPIYNTNRIVYQDRSFKRDVYVYHQWSTKPGAVVTQLLTRDMRQSGLFKAVLSYDTVLPFTYLLEGSVDEFYEKDTEGEWIAVLTVSITLVSEKEPDINKRILVQKTYHAEKACEQKNPGALAKAMSLALREVSERLMKDVYSCLKGSRQ